jgi:dipeptidyl aminopeptidase/acylaminoacyl peptidase
MVGDPKTDFDMLQANSPLRRVADIKVPVLLAQGLLDLRVPREHADDFESAAGKAGVQIERINYNNEAHGFSRSENQTDFWQRLATFLGRSLKP